MYIHRVIRTQLYLDERLHARLKDISKKQGKTISELVREALVRLYGSAALSEELRTLDAVAGLWKDRADIGDTREYIRRLRDDRRRTRYLDRVRRRK
jgi:hypothetical protein